MSDHADWDFAVEIHPEHWLFPAGSTWIAGWIWPKAGRLVTDLRAWIDGQPFLGLNGLPRPEIERRYGEAKGPPYAGFSFLLTPHAGAKLLRLEVRDPTGLWTEFFRTPITAHASAVALAPPAPLSERLALLLPALLRLQNLRPKAPAGMLADEVISSSLSEPLNSLPNPPFYGALETPASTGWLRYGRLSITGWLTHRDRKIVRLSALADAVQESAIVHNLPRHDQNAFALDLPGRGQSQFVGHADLPSSLSSPALLKIFAELDNGERHLAFAHRFTPRVIAGADAALPMFSRFTFARALWHLARSARRHGLRLGSVGGMKAASVAALQTYRAEAPHSAGRSRALPVASPARAPASSTPLRAWVITHNLNLEGAPWFIFEYARYLSRQPGVSVQILSPSEGPLRRAFEDAGLAVSVLDLSSAFKAETASQFDDEIARVAAGLDGTHVDVVIANTMVAFWGVHLARLLKKPSVLYVHESAAIRRFFEPVIHPALFETVEAAFRLASRVVFTADASQQVFSYLNTRRQFRLLPSWVDATRVEKFAQTTGKRALRIKHGLDPDATLVINVGSVCERKGQHVFIRSLALLKDELHYTYPGKKILFPMVGARPGFYLDSLNQELKQHALESTFFMPETSEIYDFYRLADIFVCSSFEESFPRVLMESAIFGLPIVSTRVNGIPEMLAEDEAWLVTAGDRFELAEGIKRALAAHLAGDTTRPDKARRSVLARFHADKSMPLHLDLVRETLSEQR